MKARIEFDVPVDCADCPCIEDGDWGDYCRVSNPLKVISNKYIRPDWCPLQIIEGVK
jgi:hypothetical protein